MLDTKYAPGSSDTRYAVLAEWRANRVVEGHVANAVTLVLKPVGASLRHDQLERRAEAALSRMPSRSNEDERAARSSSGGSLRSVAAARARERCCHCRLEDIGASNRRGTERITGDGMYREQTGALVLQCGVWPSSLPRRRDPTFEGGGSELGGGPASCTGEARLSQAASSAQVPGWSQRRGHARTTTSGGGVARSRLLGYRARAFLAFGLCLFPLSDLMGAETSEEESSGLHAPPTRKKDRMPTT